MTALDFGIFDADNHYYEATDAFTRYIPREMAKRAVQWATIDGRTKLLVGGQVCNFIPNPTFDPVARPGALMEFFKGNTDADVKTMFGELEPIRPEYRDRDARLSVMDQQGMDACWLFPTLGVGIEQALQGDPEAATAAFTAFNRWLDDDWGYAYQDRLFAAPYMCLMDLDGAVAELERVLDRGARIVCLLPAPVWTPSGTTSPFTEDFDPFWARVAEAGVTVAFHGGDSGYARHVAEWERTGAFKAFFATPLTRVITSDRPIIDTMSALICHKTLERFPSLRIASIENGSAWVRTTLKKLDLAGAQTPGWFSERPSETFHRHVWVSPFWEDNVSRAVSTIGVDRTLFGSDWPHTEGIPEPADYVHELEGVDPVDVEKIMRTNAASLTQPALAPAA